MTRSFWRRLARATQGSSSPLGTSYRFRPNFESLEDRLVPSGDPLAGITSLVNAHLVPLASDLLGQQAVQSASYATPAAYGSAPGSVSPGGGNAPGGGFSPGQILHAYGFDQISFSGVKGDGRGQTIAIVDAYTQPHIVSDLAAFDTQFGIAAPPNFTIVNETGGSSLPTTVDNSWALEITIDVEWAHAIAPGANILLVETNSNSWSDLFQGVNYARNYPGVSVVSMSFGGTEYSGETSYDGTFTTPSGHQGVTFIACTGDSGSNSVWSPSTSPNVLAVGGTNLTLDSSNNWQSETGWSGSGGGISTIEKQPTYQTGVVTQSSTMRTIPDVSAVASSSTPLGLYDTTGGWNGWMYCYGTSVAAPQWAGLIAIANQGRAAAGQGTLNGQTQTLPKIYSLPQSDFHDIVSGSNGKYSAGAGYDLVTGRGTPYANLIVPALIDSTVATGTPPTVATPASATPSPVTGTTTNLSVLGSDALGAASLTYSWTVTSEPSGVATPTFSANGTNAAQKTTATFHGAGNYTFQVTITDTLGLTTTSNVSVTVNQTLTGVKVTPGNSTIATGASQQFVAKAVDQFGNAMGTQPGFTWTLSGIGSLNSTGAYTAPTSTGTATVKAASGTLNGSAAVTVTVAPAAPTNLTATAVSKHQVSLSWQESSTNQTGFIIQRSTDGVTWKQIATVGASALSYQDTTVNRHTSYFYRVEAYNAAGNSPWSNVASVTTPGGGGGPGGIAGSLNERAITLQNRFAARILAGLQAGDSISKLDSVVSSQPNQPTLPVQVQSLATSSRHLPPSADLVAALSNAASKHNSLSTADIELVGDGKDVLEKGLLG